MTESPDPSEGPDPRGETLDVKVARLQERAKTFATREWVWKIIIPTLAALLTAIYFGSRLIPGLGPTP